MEFYDFFKGHFFLDCNIVVLFIQKELKPACKVNPGSIHMLSILSHLHHVGQNFQVGNSILGHKNDWQTEKTYFLFRIFDIVI